MEMTCREVRRAVQISTREPVSYAAMKTNDSPFNLMNDAEYVDGCSKEEYLRCVAEGVNHAEFVMGIGPDAESMIGSICVSTKVQVVATRCLLPMDGTTGRSLVKPSARPQKR